MKKLATLAILISFFESSAYALGTPSFSINDGDNQKGTLSMQELYIGGVRTHENVKIEFDFEKSTFRLLELVEADNSIPAEPIENVTINGITVGLRGCSSENRVVTCHLILTSNEFDKSIAFCANSSSGCGNDDSSTSFDNLNNSYVSSKITIANSTSTSKISNLLLVADIPTQATVEFTNISTQATNFSLIKLGFDSDVNVGNTAFEVEFRNVNFN